MAKVLVTGGCGYIGSHTVVDLLENGYEVISADSLFNADESVLDGIEAITGHRVSNYRVDLAERTPTLDLFAEHPDLVGVIHFAAHKFVGESVEKPLRYFRNNLNSLINVLEGMSRFGVPHFIFSSSCSVYGNAEALPVTEQTPWEEAESTYARTKQMGEQIVRDFLRAHPGQQSILLRYFNPAGAHPSAHIGESPIVPATNLVPVITEVAIGKRKELIVFGDDYPTRDGSCIRDYIHIMDLARAHTLALQYLEAGRTQASCEVYNLGIGEGVSVLEAVRAFERVTGRQLNYRIGERRPGDVVAIYANNERAGERLGWQARFGIEEIMRTAWAWEKARTAVSS